jgi:hypothetical protein
VPSIAGLCVQDTSCSPFASLLHQSSHGINEWEAFIKDEFRLRYAHTNTLVHVCIHASPCFVISRS